MKYLRRYVVKRGDRHYGPFESRWLAITFTHEWTAKRYPHNYGAFVNYDDPAHGFDLVLVKGMIEGLHEAEFLREELNEKLKQEAHTPEVYDDEEELRDD